MITRATGEHTNINVETDSIGIKDYYTIMVLLHCINTRSCHKPVPNVRNMKYGQIS